MTDKDKWQRACALLQLLINAKGDTIFDIEDEVREQLKEWSINVPECYDM